MLATLAQRNRFRDVLMKVMDQMKLNQSSFAAKLGVPDRTLRGWLNDQREPSYGAISSYSKKWPTELVQAIVQDIAGPRLLIEPMPPRDGVNCIQTRAHSATINVAKLNAEISQAKADGHIDPKEASQLMRRWFAAVSDLKAISVELSMLIAKSIIGHGTRRSA